MKTEIIVPEPKPPRKLNEFRISKSPNMPLTKSEKTGVPLEIQPLKHHKDIAKMNQLIRDNY